MEETTRAFSLEDVQSALGEAGLGGWLFYDFRGLDPIARKILCLDVAHVGTRRWFYFVPAQGEPRKLVHAIEPAMLATLPGSTDVYLSWQSLRRGLEGILPGSARVAMQYSPENQVPYVSRVDGGTLELVRSLGPEVVSSADLVQTFDATLTPSQVESHGRAANLLRRLIDEVFGKVAEAVRAGRKLDERAVLTIVEQRLSAHELVYDHPPIVAVNEHAADPHFEVPDSGSAPVGRGDLLLVDVWAKEAASGSIYADITWTTYIGEIVPDEIVRVFEAVRDARDATIEKARAAFRSGTPIHGFELDRVARGVIEKAGYGDYFIHRTGHSIHEEGHGNGANLDDLETHDTRQMLPGTLFSIEPGIYLPGRFGIRSEVNGYHTGKDLEITGPPHQDEIEALLARPPE
jgi:Xaa-Pro aminopeptidase